MTSHHGPPTSSIDCAAGAVPATLGGVAATALGGGIATAVVAGAGTSVAGTVAAVTAVEDAPADDRDLGSSSPHCVTKATSRTRGTATIVAATARRRP